MASVYTTQFFSISGVNIDDLYLVPAGHIAVVRDITVFFQGTPEDTAIAVVDDVTRTQMYYHLQVDENEYTHQEMRQVVQPEQTIEVISSGPNIVHCRVAGYLLTLP